MWFFCFIKSLINSIALHRKIWTRSETNSSWRPTASAIKHSPVVHRVVSTVAQNSLLPYHLVITARMEAEQFRETTGDSKRINTMPRPASSKVISYRHPVRRQDRHRLPVDICSIRSMVRLPWLLNPALTPTIWWTKTVIQLPSSPVDQASQSHSFLVSSLITLIIMMSYGCHGSCCINSICVYVFLFSDETAAGLQQLLPTLSQLTAIICVNTRGWAYLIICPTPYTTSKHTMCVGLNIMGPFM